MLRFDDLIAGAVDVFLFDFSNLLDTGETIVGLPALQVSVLSGSASSPLDLVDGPIVANGGTGVAVTLKGQQAGVTYCLAMTVDTNKGRHLIAPASLKIVTPCKR